MKNAKLGEKVEEVKEAGRVGEVGGEDMGSGDCRRHFARLLRLRILAMTVGGAKGGKVRKGEEKMVGVAHPTKRGKRAIT